MLGCGLVALAVHLKNRSRFIGAEVTAIAESDEKRLERAHQLAPTVAAYTNYSELLGDKSINAVIISVPYEEHAAATMAALDAGKHVYLEKPFTTTLVDAIRVREAWRASRLIGTMGFNYRFNPLIARMRETVSAGKLGSPVCIQTSFSFAPHGGVDWAITRHGEFGALFDLGPHEIDLARFLTGAEVLRVGASPRSVRTANDTVLLAMEMEGGTLVQSFLSTNCIEEHSVTYYGTEGKLSADLCRTPGLRFQGRKAGGNTPFSDWAAVVSEAPFILEKLRSPWNEPAFLRSMNAFLQAVRLEKQTTPSFEDGYRSHLVIEAARESIECGRMVEVAGS
jgi:predicted dehydrogenase